VLNAIKLYERGKFNGKEELMAEIDPIVRKVESWGALGPLLRPYLALLRAELERVTGESGRPGDCTSTPRTSPRGITTPSSRGTSTNALAELLHQTGHGSGECTSPRRPPVPAMPRREDGEQAPERHPVCTEEEKTSYRQTEEEYSSQKLPDLDVEYLMKASLASPPRSSGRPC
jgi:hypothetical protein